MAEPLKLISQQVEAGVHALLIPDRAGGQSSPKGAVPDNITLVPRPPGAPEVNPVGNVWPFIRDTWLSTLVFKTCDDIADHCCQAWNTLRHQPGRVLSIGGREWDHRVGAVSDGMIDCLSGPFNPAALWIHADKGGFPVSATVGGRDDYDALPLRSLARMSEDLRQARRLLSLACVYDGMSRADAAKGGGVRWRRLDLQRGSEDRFGVVSHERTLPGCLQRPAFPASPGARNTRTRTRASWRLSKNVPQSLASPLNHGPADRPIEVRVQDEARIGQKTGRGRIRARKGTRPRWPADQRYKSACLSGAVCADRETGAAMLP